MSESTLSSELDLTLIGRLFRRVRSSGSSRADAMQAALDAYRALHPGVAEADARETVGMFIKASSEAGRIWIDN
jgi:hypothetical protein